MLDSFWGRGDAINSHPLSQLEWEVVIVDDNSPDGTQEIANQLTKVYGEDKIVRIIAFVPLLVYLNGR